MASTTRIDELKKKFDENPRRYFAPLANEFRKSGEIDQAIMICEEFLPQQPGHMSGHIVYGQALFEAGRLPEARGVFETALGLDPENLIALRHLGDIARSENDPASARSWYVRVLDADPRNEEIQSLISGLDMDAGLVDIGGTADHPAPAAAGLGLDIEKETSPFDAAATPAAPSHADRKDDMSFDRHAARDNAAPAPIDLSLAETAPAGVPIIPAPASAPAPQAPELLDGFSLSGFDGGSTHRDGPQHATLAEGFESTEFEPPTEHVEAEALDASLDSGVPSFSAPEHAVEALEGLEGSGGHAHEDLRAHRASVSAIEPLDLEGGLLLPSEVMTPSASLAAPAFDEPPPAADLLDFDLSVPGDTAQPDVHEENARQPDDTQFDAPLSVDETVPTELPPEVIAAEAELTAAEDVPSQSPEYEDEPEVAARPPFVTETMAELYLAQGFREQALAVYSDLLAASPGDERLSGIVANLTRDAASESVGPNVRDFFARIASRRPGTLAASYAPPADDDFGPAVDPGVGDAFSHDEGLASAAEPSDFSASSDAAGDDDLLESPEVAAEAPEPETAPAAVTTSVLDVAPAIERVAATHQRDGSIDALFGNRSAGTSEDSAAAALAQAFGGGSDLAAPPPIPGRPARAATAELSLDSVFRDGPARPARSSQSFSFDQFFAGAEDRAARLSPPRGTAVPGEARAPAERGADDIEQFNSWLQGLKQR